VPEDETVATIEPDHVLVERSAVLEAVGKDVRLDPLDRQPASAHRVSQRRRRSPRVALFSNRHEFGIIKYPTATRSASGGATTTRSTT
jgi:hypothetical protein